MTTTTENPVSRFAASALSGRMLALGMGITAFILFAALFSHNPQDASLWNATGRDVSNWIGSLGANLSRALICAIGQAAWL